ncbi:MAG TPA: septum formation initiator family protein [Acidimicrobiia bacterium]
MPDRGRGAKTGKSQPRRSPARNPALADLRHRRRVLVRVLLGAMAIVALLFVFVFPARTLLAQRQQTDKERKTLQLLHEQSRKLAEESQRLQSDAEVQRMAREQYGFVYPGEHPFVVVPPSTTSPPAPTTSAPATTSPAPKR